MYPPHSQHHGIVNADLINPHCMHTHKQDLCIHYIFVGAADFFYLAKQMYFLFGKISPSFCPKISHTKHWSLMRGYVVSLQVTQKR